MDQIIIYILYFIFKEKLNEKFTKEGDSPVFKNKFNYVYKINKQNKTRGILFEDRRTTF